MVAQRRSWHAGVSIVHPVIGVISEVSLAARAEDQKVSATIGLRRPEALGAALNDLDRRPSAFATSRVSNS